jgi:hypothetical protein
LYGFAALVNGKLEDTERNKSACGILVNNITVNDDVLDEDGTLKADEDDLAPWTPIMSFSGKFDGTERLFLDFISRVVQKTLLVCSVRLAKVAILQ